MTEAHWIKHVFIMSNKECTKQFCKLKTSTHSFLKERSFLLHFTNAMELQLRYPTRSRDIDIWNLTITYFVYLYLSRIACPCSFFSPTIKIINSVIQLFTWITVVKSQFKMENANYQHHKKKTTIYKVQGRHKADWNISGDLDCGRNGYRPDASCGRCIYIIILLKQHASD